VADVKLAALVDIENMNSAMDISPWEILPQRMKTDRKLYDVMLSEKRSICFSYGGVKADSSAPPQNDMQPAHYFVGRRPGKTALVVLW
jgi:hypothetical protein